MNTFLSQVLPILQTAFLGVLLAVITYVGQAIVKATPDLIALIVAKVGLTKYNKYKLVAVDIWNKLEEDGRLGDFVGDKLTQFTTLMKVKFPKISDADIDLLNKAIAGEINKDKPLIIAAINADLDESGRDKAIDAPTPTSETTTIPDTVVVPETVVEPPITSDTIITPTEKEVVVETPTYVKQDVVLGVIPTTKVDKSAEVKVDTNAEILAQIQVLLAKK